MNRKEINYFEGVNTGISYTLVKSVEFSNCENARSKTIGSIQKRNGITRLGNEITSTQNYGLFFFENTTTANNGFYRLSTVGGATTFYYLSSSNVWTALTGNGTNVLELGDSTTQFDITNPSGSTFRYTYDTTGTDPDVDGKLRINSIVVIAAQNFTAANNGTFTVTAVSTNYFEVTNAAGVIESNKTIGTGSISVTVDNFDFTIAEEKLFAVNGNTDGLEIANDGTTIIRSTSINSNLYGAPKAHKINYYKDRLYIADYVLSSKRHRNSIMFSSNPLGIASLVNGDHDAGVTTIEVTDTKYIHSTDSLDVYRGGTKIETLTIGSKTEDSITTFATSNALKSSDELWVANTYSGERVFRWANNPDGGINVKQYDSFKLGGTSTGYSNDSITMIENIGDLLVISNKKTLAIWNDSNLQYIDSGFGCVSKNGYVKAFGVLFFIGYKGLYAMTTGLPKFMSAKVQEYFDGATKAGLEASSMGIKEKSVFFSLGDVTLYNSDGSIKKTLSDVVIDYNVQQENFYPQTGIAMSFSSTYISSTNPDRLEYCSTDGHVYEFLYGSNDNDSEIPFIVTTQPITLGKKFENISYLKNIVVESDRGNNIKCFISLDNEPFYEIQGSAEKGCTIFKVNSRNSQDSQPPRCRKISISLRETSKSICKISRLAVEYDESEETEEQRK